MIDFTNVPTAELVATHNECAEALGINPVKKFSDRATAEKRTRFVLSQILPAKRPGRFREEPALPGGAKALEAKKADMDVKPPPPRKMTDAEANAAAQKNSAAIRGEAPESADPTTDPAVAPLVAHLLANKKAPAGPRWRKPKKVAPSKIAYRPKPNSLQQQMYNMLTAPGGVTVEAFCAAMEAAGAKPTMTRPEQTWSNLGYLFVSLRGYGLEFDGQRIWLLVPADERDAIPAKRR